MDAAVIVTIGSVAAAVITGLLGWAAKRSAPQVSKNAVVVESALALVEAHRREHERDDAEIEALKFQLEAVRRENERLRHENDQLRRSE